jgi:hypothetical protein
MNPADSPSSPSAADACPASAVSHGVGLAGLGGLALWTAIAWHYGMDGPHAGIAAVFACGAPMVLWSLLVDKVHRNPSTGIDWRGGIRTPREAFDISIVKLAGLWATWGAIALFYGTARWYWEGHYSYAMSLLTWAVIPLVALSIPYVIWLDRRLIDPKDGAYAMGQWIIGGAAGKPAEGAIGDHLRAWGVKAFFLAFMLSITPANFANVIGWRLADLWLDPLTYPVALANFLITVLFLIDVAFATIGYMLTMKPLDAHIRSANPHVAGWVAALICYPPFVLMGGGGPLDYHRGTAEWSVWLEHHPLLLSVWGGLLVLPHRPLCLGDGGVRASFFQPHPSRHPHPRALSSEPPSGLSLQEPVLVVLGAAFPVGEWKLGGCAAQLHTARHHLRRLLLACEDRGTTPLGRSHLPRLS